MLLNTDLHGQNVGRKMTCNEFIDNLAGLNECENFPREILKHLYQAIKNYPLEWALDEESDECASQVQIKQPDHNNLTSNPFLEIPNTTNAIEYKKGYVMRKCCYETNNKKSKLDFILFFSLFYTFAFSYSHFLIQNYPEYR